MKIVAHRGDCETHEENTMRAFSSALNRGADSIECDVQSTSDGVLIVVHDSELGRLIVGSGFISETPYRTLQKLSGSETVPLFKEFVETFKGKIGLEIELKYFGEEFVEKVARELGEPCENVEITSNSVASLETAWRKMPWTSRGLIVSSPPSYYSKRASALHLRELCKVARSTIIHVPSSSLSVELFEKLQSPDLTVHSADCDCKETLSKAQHMEVSQISTSHLSLALAYSGKKKAD